MDSLNILTTELMRLNDQLVGSKDSLLLAEQRQGQSQSAAASSESTASTKASEATTQATKAKTAADSAMASKDSASSSASSASSSASTASQQADRAKTEADRAQEISNTLVAGFSSTIWDETSDTISGVGAPNGVTQVHKAMRRCLLSDGGTVNYYLDRFNSNLKEDGTTAVLTGEDGQVMVEIPKCYVKVLPIQGGVSPIVEWSVSAEPRLGYILHPAFTSDGTLVFDKQLGMWTYQNVTKTSDYLYVGAYDASVQVASNGSFIDGLNLDSNTSRVNVTTDKLSSVSGKYPMVGLTRAEFNTVATNRGAGWQQVSLWIESLLQILYVTEYKDLDSQAAISYGNQSLSYLPSSSNQADSPHSMAGKSNAIGHGSGGVHQSVRDTAWMSYRGIENLWGNCWTAVDGVNVLDGVYWVTNKLPYTPDTSTNYTRLGSQAPTTWGFIRKLQYSTLCAIPLTNNGTSNTGFCDDYYQNAGWRVRFFGGHANAGATAGAFAGNVNNTSSYRNRSVGARLCYKQ